MNIEKGMNNLQLPDYYRIESVTFVSKENWSTVLWEVPIKRLTVLRERDPDALGIPTHFAITSRGLEFFPSSDYDGELRVRYYTVHEV